MTGHRTARWSWSSSMHLKWSNGTCMYVLTPLPLLSECLRWRRSCTSDQSLGRRENQTTVRRHANTYRTPLFCQDSIWAVGGATAPREKPGPEPGESNPQPPHVRSEHNAFPIMTQEDWKAKLQPRKVDSAQWGKCRSVRWTGCKSPKSRSGSILSRLSVIALPPWPILCRRASHQLLGWSVTRSDSLHPPPPRNQITMSSFSDLAKTKKRK